MIIVGPVFLVAIVWFVWMVWSVNSTASLQKKVVALGNVTQYTFDDMTQRLGAASAVANGADGGCVVQWRSPRYLIVMSFDSAGQCLGIEHEARA